jgi:hypothetical protein
MQSSTHKLFVKTSIATAALLAIAYGTAAHSQTTATVQVTDNGGASATVYTKDGADTAAQAKADTAKSEAISEAATDATNKVNALATGQVETNRQAIGAEATARANADTAEATARANADTAEATARANADTAIRQDFQAADQRLSQRIEGNTQGIANVTAMASMPALPAGAESGVTAGVGSYNGKNAVAIGFQHRFNANTTFKVAAATGSNGKPAVGTGVSYAWGGPTQAVPGQSQQVVALQDQLRAQATENTELKQRQQAQGETIAAQAAEIAELKRQVSLVLAQQK